MKQKILIPVIFGIAITIILMTVLVTINQKPITVTEKPINENLINENPINQKPIPTREQPIPINDTVVPINETIIIINDTAITPPITPIDLSYTDSNSIMKSSLASKGISMSSSIKISGDSIAKYCTFFSDKDKQNSIKYCTSTELKDSDGKFLGNIHMVGSMDSPNAVLGVIQTDPYMSSLDDIKTTYQVMVESLVCDCSQDQKLGNLESVTVWVDATKSHHLESKHITTHSEIGGMAQKQLVLEVTTNTEGYLWKFIITN
jgi:hypothetical protein